MYGHTLFIGLALASASAVLAGEPVASGNIYGVYAGRDSGGGALYGGAPGEGEIPKKEQ